MDPKDLRIGNLFIEENSKQIIEVIGLEKNRVIFSGMFLEKWQAKPIILTDEWLMKFGFEKNKENKFRLKDRLIVLRDGFFHDYGTSVKLKYVHQLQNLYFSLTGKELI